MGSRRFCPPLIVVWSIVACGDDDPTTLSSSATGTSLSAPISDDPIVATPSAAEPGDLVELTFPTDLDRGRSEEHTSELQSLMRISYAVFCLNKKKTIYPQLTKLYTKQR